jgi:hypothetical protein
MVTLWRFVPGVSRDERIVATRARLRDKRNSTEFFGQKTILFVFRVNEKGAGRMEIDQDLSMNTGSVLEQDNYVMLILGVMRSKNIGLRALASSAGIRKSRAGILLHRDPSKRSAMGLSELQAILRALDIDLLQAIIWAETIKDERIRSSPRYAGLVPMLCDMFYGLPANLIAALDEIEAMDGSEVRPEWATALQRAVIKRIVHEINAVTVRRAALNDFSIFAG